MKGLDGSNPPLSANQSVHLAYILENGRRSARNEAFFQLAAQQREPAHAGFSQFGEHSLCAKQKRFASAPERALGGVRPTIASPGDRQLNFDRSYLTWTTRIGAALSVPDLRGSSRCLAGSNRESRRLRGWAVAPAVDGVVVEAPVWADAHGGQLVQVHQAADECDRALAITAGLFDRVAHVGFRAGFRKTSATDWS
jgi:hypothetical protein